MKKSVSISPSLTASSNQNLPFLLMSARAMGDPKSWNGGTVNGGTVERWNGGTVNGGTVERWNGGTVERWNGGMVEW